LQLIHQHLATLSKVKIKTELGLQHQFYLKHHFLLPIAKYQLVFQHNTRHGFTFMALVLNAPKPLLEVTTTSSTS
jgi:hypothetical protein